MTDLKTASLEDPKLGNPQKSLNNKKGIEEPVDDLKAYSEELEDEDAEDDFDESDDDDIEAEEEIDYDAEEDEDCDLDDDEIEEKPSKRKGNKKTINPSGLGGGGGVRRGNGAALSTQRRSRKKQQSTNRKLWSTSVS